MPTKQGQIFGVEPKRLEQVGQLVLTNPFDFTSEIRSSKELRGQLVSYPLESTSEIKSCEELSMQLKTNRIVKDCVL